MSSAPSYTSALVALGAALAVGYLVSARPALWPDAGRAARAASPPAEEADGAAQPARLLNDASLNAATPPATPGDKAKCECHECVQAQLEIVRLRLQLEGPVRGSLPPDAPAAAADASRPVVVKPASERPAGKTVVAGTGAATPRGPRTEEAGRPADSFARDGPPHAALLPSKLPAASASSSRAAGPGHKADFKTIKAAGEVAKAKALGTWCDECQRPFSTLHSFRDHKRDSHVNIGGPGQTWHVLPPTVDEMADASAARYACRLCDKVYTNEMAIRQHVPGLHPWVVCCYDCNLDFSVPAEAVKHHNLIHRKQYKLPSPDPACDQCGASFSAPALLAEHKADIFAHGADDSPHWPALPAASSSAKGAKPAAWPAQQDTTDFPPIPPSFARAAAPKRLPAAPAPESHDVADSAAAASEAPWAAAQRAAAQWYDDQLAQPEESGSTENNESAARGDEQDQDIHSAQDATYHDESWLTGADDAEVAQKDNLIRDHANDAADHPALLVDIEGTADVPPALLQPLFPQASAVPRPEIAAAIRRTDGSPDKASAWDAAARDLLAARTAPATPPQSTLNLRADASPFMPPQPAEPAEAPPALRPHKFDWSAAAAAPPFQPGPVPAAAAGPVEAAPFDPATFDFPAYPDEPLIDPEQQAAGDSEPELDAVAAYRQHEPYELSREYAAAQQLKYAYGGGLVAPAAAASALASTTRGPDEAPRRAWAARGGGAASSLRGGKAGAPGKAGKVRAPASDASSVGGGSFGYASVGGKRAGGSASASSNGAGSGGKAPAGGKKAKRAAPEPARKARDGRGGFGWTEERARQVAWEAEQRAAETERLRAQALEAGEEDPTGGW